MDEKKYLYALQNELKLRSDRIVLSSLHRFFVDEALSTESREDFHRIISKLENAMIADVVRLIGGLHGYQRFYPKVIE